MGLTKLHISCIKGAVRLQFPVFTSARGPAKNTPPSHSMINFGSPPQVNSTWHDPHLLVPRDGIMSQEASLYIERVQKKSCDTARIERIHVLPRQMMKYTELSIFIYIWNNNRGDALPCSAILHSHNSDPFFNSMNNLSGGSNSQKETHSNFA